MAAPILNSVAYDVCRSLRPLFYSEQEHGYPLQRFVGSIMDVLMQELDDWVRDTPDGPGWSILFDLPRTPAKALPWLSQFVGVSLPVGLSEADQRQYILDTPNWKRGTVEAMVGAAKPYLTGNKSVTVRERDGSPYRITINTRISETPDSFLVLTAMLTKKPGGIILNYNVIPGQDYLQLRTNWATYQAVKTNYADYEAVRLGP